MKKLFAFALPLLLSGLAHAQPSATYMQDILNNAYTPGANAVIIKDGHWMYQQNWGKANIAQNQDVSRQTLFMMASISKTVIATALMQLWEKGAFQLDDNINSYLPFQVYHPVHANDSVTFRMLAMHTSGIKDNNAVMGSLYMYGDSPMSLDTLLRNYLVPGGNLYSATGNFYAYHMGKSHSYSNIGATLAAYLVQRITGDDFAHYCDTAIFQKLCMDHTSYKLAGISDTTLIARPYMWDGSTLTDAGLYGYADYPDGQLRTNITALARFMTMYMQYGQYQNTRILDSATVAYMMTPQTPLNTGQGIFFSKYTVDNETLWGHTGGDAGVSTAMFFNYTNQTGVIVLTNGDGTPTVNMLTIFDTLYRYGRNLTPSVADTFPACNYVTGVPNISKNAAIGMQLYPNPASHTAWLLLNTPGHEDLDIVLTDMQGRIIKKIYNGKGSENQKITIDLTDINSGLYLVQCNAKNARKVIKFTVVQ